MYSIFQAWEKGIELCKVLSLQYELELFDYNKLSDLLVSKFIYLYHTRHYQLFTFERI